MLSLAAISKLATPAHVRYVDSAALEELDNQARRYRALRILLVIKRSKLLALRAFSHTARAQAEPTAQTHIRIQALCRLLL